MAIGRNIKESLKACRSMNGVYHNEMLVSLHVADDALVERSAVKAQDDRLFLPSEAIRRGYTIEEFKVVS